MVPDGKFNCHLIDLIPTCQLICLFTLVHRTIKYGGLFMYPGSKDAPNGKVIKGFFNFKSKQKYN